MGFVVESDRKRNRSRTLVISATAAYAVLVCTTVSYHEPWADEAQAWLIARDSSFRFLWGRILHYEGTPGLWHSLLWLLTRAHVPFQSLGYISASFGVASAYLINRYAPFCLPVRLLLPFTYFFAYQYAVISRSYVLIPPILLSLAALHPNRSRHSLLQALLLGLLALCSLHGLVLSAILMVFLGPRKHAAIAIYVLAVSLSLWSAWPAQDVTFVRHYNLAGPHFLETAGRVLAEAFTTEQLTAIALIATTFPYLARGRSLILFFVSALALVSLAAVVYGQVWHFGLLFLMWIFSLWVAALQTPSSRWSHYLATGALSVALAIHCYWTASAIRREVQTAYSGGQAAARYLTRHNLPQAGLYGVGYACVAVQPYFHGNVFTNFKQSYWDWSSRNTMIADYDKLPNVRPPWILVGFKTAEENYLWNSQVHRSGYRKIKHFEGNLIWEDEQFEPESFDLYQRQ